LVFNGVFKTGPEIKPVNYEAQTRTQYRHVDADNNLVLGLVAGIG